MKSTGNKICPRIYIQNITKVCATGNGTQGSNLHSATLELHDKGGQKHGGGEAFDIMSPTLDFFFWGGCPPVPPIIDAHALK